MDVSRIQKCGTEWGILGGIIGTALGTLAGTTYGIYQESNRDATERHIREAVEDMDLREDTDDEENGHESQ